MTNVPAGAPPDGDSGFLSRWSRRKAQVRQGDVLAEPVAPAPPVALPALAALPAAPAEPAPATLAPCPTPPPPTLADVAALTRDSDYARFVAPGVDAGVKNAALKKLFTDPHFNIMDRLDTYIDDYGQPDPLPAGMLRQMAQSQFLGLFSDDEDQPPVVQPVLQPVAQPVTQPVVQSVTQPGVDPRTPALADPLPKPPVDPPARLNTTPDEDPDLRLQPNAAAGPPRARQSTGPDTGRQH